MHAKLTARDKTPPPPPPLPMDSSLDSAWCLWGGGAYTVKTQPSQMAAAAEECVCSFYGQPRALALALAADCSLSPTPSCQRCNSILEEALTAAMKSTSDESSLEVVN